MNHDSERAALRAKDRVLIRDVQPSTPLGLSPKVVAGDQVSISARLVADGHDILAAQLRIRQGTPQGSGRVSISVETMTVDHSGVAESLITLEDPGLYEFQIRGYVDRFATWRRDLVLRSEAGENLEVEFAEGALILERTMGSIPASHRPIVRSAIESLRSDTCSEQVKFRAATDQALFEVAASRSVAKEMTSSKWYPLRADSELAVFGSWYEFFPRSEGGFVKGARSWDRLEAAAQAGFDVVYLPPIHPIGTTHRKGRNNTLVAKANDVGSPWAIGSSKGGHDAIEPSLGTLADFEAFVDHARSIGIEIALDYALQCSPDHPWVTEHPEWFNHRVDGTIRYAENPPKKYQDIYPINFWPEDDNDRVALWSACLGILQTWIDRGIRVFRVDNPHTKPLAFWRWAISEVQRNHPEVVFLSEAFTDPPMMHSLAEIGFSQSYTYFTWRHTKSEITDYGEELAHAPTARWFRPNLWPNTPDILTGQLRNGTPEAFELRALLAATLAPSWGIYSGYELCEGDPHPEKEEYIYSEKYELKDRDHDDPSSIWPFISSLNHIRRANPAFKRMDTLTFHDVDNDDVIAYSHVARSGQDFNRVLVIANLQPDQTSEATVYLDRGGLELSDGGPVSVRDLLTGESWNWSGYGDYVRLGPADRVGHIFSVSYGPLSERT